MKKIGKVIIIILMLFIVYMVIRTIRNVLILNTIRIKESSIESSMNYSYKEEHYNSDDKNAEAILSVKHTYKDGINVVDIDNVKFNQKLITWSNEETKEQITYDINNKKANISKMTTEYSNSYPILFYKDFTTFRYLFLYAISHSISEEKIDNELCYKITKGKKSSNDISWIDKESGVFVKTIYGTTQDDNGKKVPNVVRYSDWTNDTVLDSDIEKLDLIDYVVTEE